MAMMMPEDGKRLKVIDRIVTVIRQIKAGSDFFYTPYAVVRRWLEPEECKGFPTYGVFTDSGGRTELQAITGTPNLFDEIFYINIKGYVRDTEDTVSKLERALRDVRKAINEDAEDTATTGSLGQLCDECFIEDSPETDNGYYWMMNLGFSISGSASG
jgi:hypothetical protein